MTTTPSRRARTALVLSAAVAVGLGLWWRSRDAPPGPRPAAPTTTTPAAETADAATGREDAPDAPPRGADGRLEAVPETPWAAVDLDAIREVMPDNLFWKMAVPTNDPEIIAQRAEERDRWNTEYGKVLSGTATAEEVDAYYAERQRLAQDYVEFATYLLAEYGDRLTVRDVGLLKVAIELNLARLERFPREIVEAHERREAHDAARREWLEQQRAFEDAPIR